MHRHMCQALMRSSLSLREAGLLPVPESPFNSEEERFEQRFGAFGVLVLPEPLRLEQYLASMDTSRELGCDPSVSTGPAPPEDLH